MFHQLSHFCQFPISPSRTGQRMEQLKIKVNPTSYPSRCPFLYLLGFGLKIMMGAVNLSFSFKINAVIETEIIQRPCSFKSLKRLRPTRITNTECPYLLVHLCWFELDFECSTVCQILPGLMGSWPEWLSSWIRWWNTQIKANPTRLHEQMGHPVGRVRPKPISAEIFCRISNRIFCLNQIVAHWLYSVGNNSAKIFCNLQNIRHFCA